MLLAAPLEAMRVLGGGPYLPAQVRLKIADDQSVSKLLGQHGGNPEGYLSLDALFEEVGQRLQQRHVGLGHDLVQGLLPVGPHANSPAEGQVRVQYERECAKSQSIL